MIDGMMSNPMSGVFTTGIFCYTFSDICISFCHGHMGHWVISAARFGRCATAICCQNWQCQRFAELMGWPWMKNDEHVGSNSKPKFQQKSCRNICNQLEALACWQQLIGSCESCGLYKRLGQLWGNGCDLCGKCPSGIRSDLRCVESILRQKTLH